MEKKGWLTVSFVPTDRKEDKREGRTRRKGEGHIGHERIPARSEGNGGGGRRIFFFVFLIFLERRKKKKQNFFL